MSFEMYKDKADEFRWRLKGTNQRIIADSGEGYKTMDSLKAGIDSVKNTVPIAKLVDLTIRA
jgi:uncharacterized protein YegP (UPF0339 family)